MTGLSGWQIADRLRAEIRGGERAPGERMPPRREYAVTLGLPAGSAAVKQAYTLLLGEGLTVVRGRSTYVADPLPPPAPEGGAMPGWARELRADVDALRARVDRLDPGGRTDD